MADTTALTERYLMVAWYAFATAITIVAMTTYHSNEKHIKELEAALPTQTWSDAAWECSRPASGSNVQVLFKGAVLRQSSAAQDRAAFSPQLRSACHSCRGAAGKFADGRELLVPGGGNATNGVVASTVASRSGLVTLGGFYNNAVGADQQAARCGSADRGSFYLVWDDAGAALHTCYCIGGTEMCGDAMFTSGDGELNCVGGSTVLPTDCSGCVDGSDRLC